MCANYCSYKLFTFSLCQFQSQYLERCNHAIVLPAAGKTVESLREIYLASMNDLHMLFKAKIKEGRQSEKYLSLSNVMTSFPSTFAKLTRVTASGDKTPLQWLNDDSLPSTLISFTIAFIDEWSSLESISYTPLNFL